MTWTVFFLRVDLGVAWGAAVNSRSREKGAGLAVQAGGNVSGEAADVEAEMKFSMRKMQGEGVKRQDLETNNSLRQSVQNGVDSSTLKSLIERLKITKS